MDLQAKLGIRSALKLLEVETVLLDRFHLNVKRFTVKASSIVCCRAARSAANMICGTIYFLARSQIFLGFKTCPRMLKSIFHSLPVLASRKMGTTSTAAV